MLANAPARQVKSVQTAFELINTVQTLGGATPTQLTEELDLSKSSVHNYLATLEMDGYVVNDGGTYRLGLRFLTHGMAAKTAAGIKRPIVVTVRSVAEELSQPTWWVTEEFGRGYFMHEAAPDERTHTYGSVGKRSYLHVHAPGKAILALSTDEYVRRIVDHHGLPEHTRRTTTDLETLTEEIATVREQGFAISEGEAVLGILSVGVAFRDPNGRRHAIGVFGQSRNFAGNRAENVGRDLVESVADLQQRLEEGGE
ncbi:IclR family transcriptional regulator [Halorarius halobius]|uniref:IclR family transcriptional regulator n=1 Tax=Halorarius halobius TaxID=2962671 RepID=UPI0020CD7A47|nr:IclR family transcriptional regulator C-terminal domain-containing protein [Halorarius halobius]